MVFTEPFILFYSYFLLSLFKYIRFWTIEIKSGLTDISRRVLNSVGHFSFYYRLTSLLEKLMIKFLQVDKLFRIDYNYKFTEYKEAAKCLQ